MTADELAKILDEVGRRIGPYGEHAWTLIVRQKITEGIVWGITEAVILIVLAVGVAKLARMSIDRYQARMAAYNNNENRGYGRYAPDLEDYVMPWVLGGVCVLTIFFIGALCLIQSILQLTNPEYYALRDLLGTIKN